MARNEIDYKASIKALYDIYCTYLVAKRKRLEAMVDALPHRDSHDTAQETPDDAA